MFSSSIPIVTHSINLYKYRDFGEDPYIMIIKNRSDTSMVKNIVSPIIAPSTTNANEYCFDMPIMCVFTTGISSIALVNIGKTRFDVDLIVSYL